MDESNGPSSCSRCIAGTGGALLAFAAGSAQLLGGKDNNGAPPQPSWRALVLFVVGGCFSLAAPGALRRTPLAARDEHLSFSGISIELMLCWARMLRRRRRLPGASSRRGVRRESAARAGRWRCWRVICGRGRLRYFCGHGYVIDAQPSRLGAPKRCPSPTWARLLARGAFAYALVAAATKTPADKAASAEELGRQAVAGRARLRRRGRRGHSRLRAVPRP